MNPGACGHIAQLYQDEDFCSEAVAHFAGSGLARGGAVVLVPTRAHRDDVARRLTQSGLDLSRLSASGQLRFLDLTETLSHLMVGGTPDARAFKAWIERTVETVRPRGNFPDVRVWGDMVHVLHCTGNRRGCLQLEELFDAAAREHSITVLCSFLMDKHNPAIYEADFRNICRAHGHVFSARDEVAHRHAVNRAIREVIGEIKGPLFRSLALWNGMPCAMSSAQALLLWVRDTLPMRFQDVMTRARAYETMAKGLQ